MKIVIDTKQCPCRTLNDECYISNNDCFEDDICSTCPLIRNGGIKLPEGHGRLIDYGYVVDAIDDWINAGEYDYTNATEYLRKRIANTPTIIEAESGVEK